tara:strand:+ start:587 stop:796 length:210 start_codon:yes stop_codon:yes gene_type:complete
MPIHEETLTATEIDLASESTATVFDDIIFEPVNQANPALTNIKDGHLRSVLGTIKYYHDLDTAMDIYPQ